MFGAGVNTENMPFTELTETDFAEDSIGILDLLIKTKLVPSRGEGRRLIEQRGISINDKKITSGTICLTKDQFTDGFVIIKKGKKVYHKAILVD